MSEGDSMAQIKVTRKSYVRKDGTKVKSTTYYTKDKGKTGKTPASEKWYEHNVEMNWHKDEPVEVIYEGIYGCPW
jgi:hypothetical protein